MTTKPVPAIDIRGLSVVYHSGRHKTVQAVSGLDLRVEPGEVVGLVGPNGAGKSTTINTLMGFVFPTQGEAHIFGKSAGSVGARRRIGYLPEVALYYPFLTARETLNFFADLQEIPIRERKDLVSTLLERVGLTGRDREPLRNFSKGMLQRVGIAQAIMGYPDLLILDEVTSGLDPVARHDVRAILLEFKSQGKTVFFSSHELSEVTLLCDRVVIVDDGKVREQHVMNELLDTLRQYRFIVSGNGIPGALPSGVTVEADPDGGRRIVAKGAKACAEARRLITESGIHVVRETQEMTSLEDYFVEAIGHKIT